jgi:hypothetical protein
VATLHSSNSHAHPQSNLSHKSKLYRSTVPGLRRIRFTEADVDVMADLWTALHPGQSIRSGQLLETLGVERVSREVRARARRA